MDVVATSDYKVLDCAPAEVFGVLTDINTSVGCATEEIFEWMLRSQNNFRVYKPDSKHLKYRKRMVDWMAEIGEEMALHRATLHVAAA